MVNVTKSQRLAHQPAAPQSIYVHDKAHHGDSNATLHVRSLARIDHLMDCSRSALSKRLPSVAVNVDSF